MLNTQKLIYVLPDLAYIAELLPAKKEHEFTVQSFRQINGTFLDDNELIEENIGKLVDKIEPEEYQLILPDFLFTNTIVEVAETSESKVETYIKEKLLPDLGISKDTHDIETSILTQYGGKSKVQLSALEKSVLNPFRAKAKNKDIKITAVSPLSWTIKSMISLEPSISVVQIGSMLYLAQHYIGVDQAISFSIKEVENISETIKTLKGAEPSIQTVYLLTNQLVEEQLKDHLSDTLPLQQLASFSDEDQDLPSYVKKIIETSMKTINISDFPVPKFPIGKIVEFSSSEPAANEEDTKPEEKEADSQEPITTDTDEETDMPKPINKNEQAENEETNGEKVEVKKEDLTEEEPAAKEEEIKEEKSEEQSDKETTEPIGENKEIDPKVEITKTENSDDNKLPEIEVKETTDNKDEPDLSKFAPEKQEIEEADIVIEEKPKQETIESSSNPSIITTKKIIKNSSGTSNMLKMVFITIATLAITVAIGVGIGLGFLSLSGNDTQPTDQTPVVESPQPTTEPSPSPSPEPEIEKSEIKLSVVNATTTAGKAGKYKTMLEEDGFEDIDAANAKGEYEEGSYILMAEENTALIKAIEEATELDLEYSKDISVEDPKEAYDAVIVLAK